MADPLFKLMGRSSAKVAKVNSSILMYEKAYPAFSNGGLALVNDNYEVGIEVEVEKVRNPEQVIEYPVWTTHDDGSLRDGGVEFVTIPIYGKRIIYALNQLYNVLQKGYRFSPRTSVHIHVNVLDLTPDQIAGMLLSYAPFEKLFYLWVGGDRDKNNFCVPLYDANAYHLIKPLTLTTYVPANLGQHRYLGVNLDAIRKFGTLEFRHLGGTDNVNTILKWINLIFRLKMYAVQNDWQSIHGRICNLNTNSAYEAFLTDVFKEEAVLLRTPSLQKDMEHIVSALKCLVIDDEFVRTFVKSKDWSKHLWYQVIHKLNVPKKEYIINLQENQGPQVVRPRVAREDLQARLDREMAMLRPGQERAFANVPLQDPQAWDVLGGLRVEPPPPPYDREMVGDRVARYVPIDEDDE